MKKLLAIIMTVFMVAACFAGCAGGGNESSAPESSKTESSKADDSSNTESTDTGDDLGISKDGTLPLVADKVDTMTMTLRVGPTDDAPNDMWFFRYYAERTNVEWQITPILTADWSEKKAVIMGSGDYTDVYWNTGFTNSEILGYGTTGIFIDLAPYYDYAPDYVAQMDSIEGSWAYVTTPDGANYSLAYIDPANYYADNSKDLWLKTSLLEDNGYNFSDDNIMTLDELYNVLSDIKSSSGLIPLTGRSDSSGSVLRGSMLNAFGFDTNGDVTQNIGLLDGKVVFMPTTERYKEYLTYMNKLYTEGLLDPDFYTQDETQLKAKTSEGAAAGWIYTVPFLMDLDHNMEYSCYAVAYDENTDPIKYQGSSVIGGKFMITDACETPELAMAWINLFYQPENAFNIMYGPTVYMDQDSGEYTIISEGITDEEEALTVAAPVILDADGNYVGIDTTVWNEHSEEYTLWDWYAKYKPVNGAYSSTLGELYIFGQLFGGMPNSYDEQVAHDKARVESDTPADNNEGWWRYNNLIVDYKWISHGYPSVYFTTEQQEWLDANSTIINDYVYQMEAQFVTGAASIEADYDAFIAELTKLGAADYEALYTEVYPD